MDSTTERGALLSRQAAKSGVSAEHDSGEINRAGISPETLRVAGIRFSDKPEPRSIEIPYHDPHGKPTGFCRWRLPRERPNGQKYHQLPDTGTRAYIPPPLHSFAPSGDLVIVEGEFKALALIEAGIKAIGLPSFNTYTRDDKDDPQLMEGIADAIRYTKPDRILFLGDSDTATNYEFARNAVFLSNTAKPIPVVLPRIPVGGPGKGIDDCREALGAEFQKFWAGLVETAEIIDPKAGVGDLAARLLEREATALKASKGLKRDKLVRQVLKLAAKCEMGSLAFDRILGFAASNFDCTKTALKKELNSIRAELRREIKHRTTSEGILRDQSDPKGSKCGDDPKLRSTPSNPERHSAGQDGHLFMTPALWFAERYPKLPEKYGNAVLEETDEAGIISARDIGEDYLAATLGFRGSPKTSTVFLPTEDKFFTYSPDEGVYIHQREPNLLTRLSGLLLECARECGDGCDTKSLEYRFRDAANLSGVIRKGRGLLATQHDFFSSDLTEYIPCANGMLRLLDKKLLEFNPSYRRRNKLAVPFDPSAKCPLFLNTLMSQALDDGELDLLQRWCGLALVGENLAQRILILTGTAGGGKGTFIRVLIGIIGQTNLASLRPQLLGERFELGRFLGKTLLYGADVPENFLNQRGASVLKSLTGYDPMTLEFKNSNESPSITCRFNVIVTCNSRLTVHLEGDTDAWRRRLAIIPYNKPKPEQVIADLDRVILETEASGVLNWMLVGLDKIRADGWQLKLTPAQQANVDNLLLESDGHSVFVRECLRRDAAQTLIVSDCFG